MSRDGVVLHPHPLRGDPELVADVARHVTESLAAEGWADTYGPLRADHLAAIKARMAKATLGPWTYEVNDRASTGSAHFAVKTAYMHPKHPHSARYVTFMCGGLGESRYLRHPTPDDYREDPDTQADTDFIAHAREDVPALVAEVERLRELVRRLGGSP